MGISAGYNRKLGNKSVIISKYYSTVPVFLFLVFFTLFIESFVMQKFIIFLQENLSVFSLINSRLSTLQKPSDIQIKNMFSDTFFKD